MVGHATEARSPSCARRGIGTWPRDHFDPPSVEKIIGLSFPSLLPTAMQRLADGHARLWRDPIAGRLPSVHLEPPLEVKATTPDASVLPDMSCPTATQRLVVGHAIDWRTSDFDGMLPPPQLDAPLVFVLEPAAGLVLPADEHAVIIRLAANSKDTLGM
jgi:hypothetical protein